MSIAQIAQSKFRFQDLVCIDLAFQFGLCGNRPGSLIVEPADGEDAEFTIAAPEGPQKIGIQVKEDSAPVTLKTLARYLWHYPERNAKNCLLEKLLGENGLVVAFVLSGRCDDQSSAYVVKGSWAGEARQHAVPLRAVRQLRGALSETTDRGQDTDVNRRRSAHARKLLGCLTDKQLRSVASRIYVKERVDVAHVRGSCARYLREQLIPVDEAHSVIDRLLAAIEDGKKNRDDVVPALKGIIKSAAPASLAPILYVRRGEEAAWESRLSDSGALLLSGRSRCGKSEAGRYIASKYQRLGFKVRQGNGADEAARYLLDTVNDQRLYLLQDPLGSLRPADQPFQVLDTLRYALAYVSPSRKLIICQNQDRLFELFRTSRFQECQLGGHAWFDLSSPPSSFLAGVWDALSTARKVATPIRRKVADALRLGNLDLEVGCLQHLALSVNEVASDAALPDLEKKAREDARDLGLALSSESLAMKQTLVALAIASDPYQPVRFEDLCYLLDSEKRELPGVKKWQITSIGNDQTPQFPEYKRRASLATSYRRCLDLLASRGFLRQASDGYCLEHPFYQAAAGAIIERLDQGALQFAVRVLRRSVFCLSRSTSVLASRQMSLIFGLINSTSGEQKLAAIAIRGLSSIFPATRDACLQFVIENFDRLPPDRVISMFALVRAVARTSLNHVEWHRGHAWIPASIPFDLDRWCPPPIARSTVESELISLDSCGSDTPTHECACNALRYLEHVPGAMTMQMVLRLLAYDESLIRAKATEIWLSADRESDSDVLERILADPHPLVTLSMVQAIVWSWNDLPVQRRQLLVNRLRKIKFSAILALPTLDWLGRFDRVEETGTNPPWIVFGEILPKVLSVLPSSANISDVRLFTSVMEGTPHLAARARKRICEEWISHLERCALTRLLTDYELGVADVAIRGVRAGTGRLSLIRRLTTLPGTAAKMLVLREVVDQWSKTSPSERDLVVELILKPSIDQYWLKAALATAHEVPRELQPMLFGELGENGIQAPDFLEHLEPKLLDSVASIYSRAGVLDSLGIRCHSEAVARLFEQIERMPQHRLFELAFSTAIDSMRDARIQAAIHGCVAEHLGRVFTIMLRKKVQWNGNWLPNSWVELLRSVDDTTRSDWFDRMADAAPGICDDLRDVWSWLIDPDYRDELLLRLPSDVLVLSASRKALDSNRNRRNPKGISRFASFLRATLRDTAPRLHGTYSQVKEAVEKLRINDAQLVRRLESRRLRAIALNSDLRKAADVEQGNLLKQGNLPNWDGRQ